MAQHGERVYACDKCNGIFDKYGKDGRLELSVSIKKSPVTVWASHPHDVCAACLTELIGLSKVETIQREWPMAVFLGVAGGVFFATLGAMLLGY